MGEFPRSRKRISEDPRSHVFSTAAKLTVAECIYAFVCVCVRTTFSNRSRSSSRNERKQRRPPTSDRTNVMKIEEG